MKRTITLFALLVALAMACVGGGIPPGCNITPWDEYVGVNDKSCDFADVMCSQDKNCMADGTGEIWDQYHDYMWATLVNALSDGACTFPVPPPPVAT